MAKYFIKKAIKHKGSLRKWAQKVKAMNKNGTINLSKAMRIAKRRGLTHRIRQINLAKNLRRMHR